MLLFVAGLAIARVHNRWTTGWPVLVTLVGWFGVAAGLGCMVATELAQQSASLALAFEVALFGVGVFLTFKAYGGRSSGVADP